MDLHTAKRSLLEERVTRVRAGSRAEVRDLLAVEEPLEIRLLWQGPERIERRSIAVTMRTPGDDFDLAAGFLVGEGLLRHRDDVADIAYCVDEGAPQTFNVVTVTLRPGLEFDAARLERNFYTTSSCGICGKAALDSLELLGCEALPPGFSVSPEVVARLPKELLAAQAVFAATGGLHAAGLFTASGELVAIREDVGRHNAVDKLLGRRFLEQGGPLDRHVLMLSGRAGFELVQKALVARIPVVASVGAPSSLAVQLARSFDLSLLGFVRRNGFNVYSGGERIRVGGGRA